MKGLGTTNLDFSIFHGSLDRNLTIHLVNNERPAVISGLADGISGLGVRIIYSRTQRFPLTLVVANTVVSQQI